MQYTENQYPFNNICIMQYTENQYNICNNACICSTLQYNANSMYVYAVHYKVQRQQYVCIWNTCTDCTKQWLYRPIYTVSYCTAKRIDQTVALPWTDSTRQIVNRWMDWVYTESRTHIYTSTKCYIERYGVEQWHWNNGTLHRLHASIQTEIKASSLDYSRFK